MNISNEIVFFVCFSGLDYKNKKIKMSLERQEDTGDFVYARSNHALQTKLSHALEDAHTFMEAMQKPAVAMVPSGNAAVFTSLSAASTLWKSNEIQLIHDITLYGESHRVIRHLKKMPHIKVWPMDFSNVEQVLSDLDHFAKKRILVFCETCANPTGTMFDPSILIKVQSITPSWHAILDNSFLTHVRLNPYHWCHKKEEVKKAFKITTNPVLKMILDPKKLTVISTCSKHYSAGQCIGGFIATNHSKLLNKIYQSCSLHGYHVSPATCRIILNKLPSMKERCNNSSELMVHNLKLVFFKYFSEPKVTLQHTSIDQEKGELKKSTTEFGHQFADIFNICISLSEKQYEEWNVEKVQALIKEKATNMILATSYGGAKTRICSYIKFKKEPVLHCQLRVSFGFQYTHKEFFIYKELISIINTILQSHE